MNGMYTDSLSLEQVADGRLKALENAEELVAEARCLYRKRRWARALFLSQIAVEEAGKYFYLFSSCVSIIKGSISWARFWKAVRSHSDKTTLFLMMEDLLRSQQSEPPRTIKTLKGDARILERGKMWALYSDFEQKEFFAPYEVIPRWLAKHALRLAWKRVRLAKVFEFSRDWSTAIRTMTRSDVEKVEALLQEQLDALGHAPVTASANGDEALTTYR